MVDCMLASRVQVTMGRDFFHVQVIYVITKIVTPCFNKPSLFSRSQMGQWDSIVDASWYFPIMLILCFLSMHYVTIYIYNFTFLHKNDHDRNKMRATRATAI